jgi:hypothetical protein
LAIIFLTNYTFKARFNKITILTYEPLAGTFRMKTMLQHKVVTVQPGESQPRWNTHVNLEYSAGEYFVFGDVKNFWRPEKITQTESY